MLGKWDFTDEAANSTTPQINRQKSARNLEVLQFDPSEPRALFFDPKRNTKHTATLSQCDCSDFNLVGTAPRKTFKPCMHIYRLAIELGLIDAKYLDHRARFALASTLSREETQRLQRLPADTAQWGNWISEIHLSGIQRNRQYRAYLIAHSDKGVICEIDGRWTIHGYIVTLNRCECLDFLDRSLPCKHIYAAALASNILLPLTYADYESAISQGIEILFEFPSST